MGMTINANLIVIILVGLLFLCYFIYKRAYKKGFDDGLKIGKMISKADMVAMLEELKKEIIELPFPQREPEYMQGYSYCQMNILDYVIQEKINSLKENKDGKYR